MCYAGLVYGWGGCGDFAAQNIKIGGFSGAFCDPTSPGGKDFVVKAGIGGDY